MNDLIRVKMLCKGGMEFWQRQLPNSDPVYRGCEFLFDFDEPDYDWLVIYDDLPPLDSERRSMRVETLNCPRDHTLLVTAEPPNIKSYGKAYTKQFGCILTSQPAWALPHKGRIYSQPALYWFYGEDSRLTYAHMEKTPATNKSKIISTVCSNKQQKHTVHNQRYEFTHALKEKLPELEIFGRGIRPIQDKSEALDAYKYHIAIENYIGENHWTEKLADPFLGACLPFYYGCPNAADYLPAESFIPIDINNVDVAAKTIRQAIDNNEYEKRLPHILEARRRVMEEHNLFAVLAREIGSRHSDKLVSRHKETLMARRALRKKPLVLISDLIDKARLRTLNKTRYGK